MIVFDRFAEWYRRMRREPELWCDWTWQDVTRKPAPEGMTWVITEEGEWILAHTDFTVEVGVGWKVSK